MISEKLFQYLTLTKQHLALIPKLQDGICSAIANFYRDLSQEKWREFIEALSRWNGQPSTLTPKLKKHFEEFWKFVDHHQLQGQVTPNYYIGDNLKPFLLDMKKNESCIVENPWHSITIKRLSEDEWEIYDPNYKEGFGNWRSAIAWSRWPIASLRRARSRRAEKPRSALRSTAEVRSSRASSGLPRRM